MTEIIRQKDPLFQRILNKVRVGIVDDDVKEVLKSREIKFISDSGLIPTMLMSTNSEVDQVNNFYYDKLEGPEFEYKIKYFWRKPVVYKEKYDTQVKFVPELRLKVGAQVIFLVNNADLELVNGSRGVIKKFVDGYPVVLFSDMKERWIDSHVLDIEENDDVIMSYSQIPLRLAFSLSIHKSQSQSISLLRISFKRIFLDNMAYTALSRATSLEGLYIRDLDFNRIRANAKAIEFYKKLDVINTKK